MSLRYETVIGLEVHAELLAESKMFCSCSAHHAGAPPNTLVCPVCLGMPGTLPVINRRAVELTVMTALALNCQIPAVARFDRKNYPYPDLMKGYQISQYDHPLSQNGWLEIEIEGCSRRIGVERVHLEEDTAKLQHHRDTTGESYSLIDVNRSGVPLMEIVSKPDIRSPAEARAYLVNLRNILMCIGANDGRWEQGSLRCDTNVSVRPEGSQELGSKVEIKNLNSLRAVQAALEFEFARQVAALEQGERIPQETRGWDEQRGVTVSQRSKEFAHDYRYFPEPDLPPVQLSADEVEAIKARIPELPAARRARFVESFGLSPYDAGILTGDMALADLFEEALAEYPRPKPIANWLIGDYLRLLNATEQLADPAVPLRGRHLAGMLRLIDDGTISGRSAKEVFEEMFATGKDARTIVEERGLVQVSDTEELERIVQSVIAANPKSVADYRGGKGTAIQFLIGQVMKQTRGRANPAVVSGLLREELDQYM